MFKIKRIDRLDCKWEICLNLLRCENGDVYVVFLMDMLGREFEYLMYI